MRYSLLFVLSFFFIGGVRAQDAGGWHGKLHIDDSYRTVSDCFRHIQDAGIVLAFNPDEIDMEKQLPLSLSGEFTAVELLKKVLGAEKYEIKRVEAQRKIVIVRKKRKYIVSGYIKEKGSQESLIAASIYAKDIDVGCVSNLYGFYSMVLPEGHVSLIASYVGYLKQSVSFELTGNVRMDVYLEPSPTQLAAVEVVAPLNPYDAEYAEVNLDEAGNLPRLFGTDDVMKHIRLLAGVGGGLSGSSRLQVRGGKADNNLVLLDDVPLYNYNHFTGLISVFNSDALQYANFYKGRFPARYGGRLSSVADIRMREGDMNRYHAGASLDMATVSAFFEGPVKKEKASFLFSARRSWIDLFTSLWGKDNRFDFSLHDLNLKTNYRISHRDRLFFSVYAGADDFIDTYSGDANDKYLSWGSGFAALRWNHLFNDRLFMNTTAYVSRFDNRMTDETSPENPLQDGQSFRFDYGIREYNLHSDIDYYDEYYHIRAGVKFTGNRFENNIYPAGLPSVEASKDITNAFQSMAYVENHISLFKKTKMNIGLNYSLYQTEKASFHLFDPRIQLTYALRPYSSLFIGFSQMNQFFHQVSVAGISFPYEVRVPSSPALKPETSRLYEAGFNISNQDGVHKFSGAFFFNQQKNILTYRPAQDLFNNKVAPDINNRVLTGERKAKGVELAYSGKKNRFDWQVSFTLSEVKERFPELNNGRFHHAPEHVEMILCSLLNWNINSVGTISASATCNSGKYITVPSYVLSTSDLKANGEKMSAPEKQLVYWFDKLSNYKLPYNYQFNIGYTYKRSYSAKKETVLQLGLYNVFGKTIPFRVDVEKGREGIEIRKTVMPHCIPYVKFAYKF